MRKPRKPSNSKTKLTFLLFFIPILFFVAIVSWANPKFKKKWSFDSDMAGTLPKNFIVGKLVDGRSAGKWQVIDMKTSMNLLDKLD